MIRSFTFSRSKWSASRTVAGVLEIEVVVGEDAPRQREDPLEVGADDAVLRRGRAAGVSSRAELAFGGLRGPRRAAPSARRAARAARSPPPAPGRPRRAPAGSPSAAGAGSTRAGPSPSPTAPATGSSSPSSNTSSSRLRIAETLRSRSSTSSVSSISWRSSVLIVRSVEATRCASALGSSTFAAASCSSSGR